MDYSSLGDLLRKQCAAKGAKPAFLIPEDGSFATITYSDLWIRVRRYATVLEDLGLVAGDRIALQSDNGVEWALLDWASRCLGVMVVPIYPTLPADQSLYIVRDAEAKLVVSGSPEQAAKVSDSGAQWVLLKGSSDSIAGRVEAAEPMAEDRINAAIDATHLDDVCTLIYTSGTTGNPKGAMLTHGNFLHVCYHAETQLELFEDTDVFLTFLPMSHVFERVAGQTLPIYLGVTIGFAKSLATLANDFQAVRPTILLSVPRFLEATMDKIIDGVKKQPPTRQKLFHLAMAQAAKREEGKFAPLAGFLDSLVGKKIRERFGGRMRFFVSGGAALPAHVARFYSSLGLTILQGWGLTETSGGTTINHPRRNKYWTVGESLGMEIKIAEDGEILVRGGALMKGYYKLPEETAKAIGPDGWFHTGDIGEFEGNSLKITDRKKDLLVLANGKNIAPQPIENKLRESQLIAEAVLFGDGNEYVYALIVPNFERLQEELKTAGVTPGTNEELIALESVKKRMKEEVDKVNKGLADFEKVKRHALLPAGFSVDSGELTPSLKVKRKIVREHFKELLATLER